MRGTCTVVVLRTACVSLARTIGYVTLFGRDIGEKMADLFSSLKNFLSPKVEEKEEERNVWRPKTIHDIPSTTIQKIMLFLVYNEPKEMLKMKLVNKYFNNIFNINYGGTNWIWKYICKNKFKNISNKLTVKRWDKLYRIRIKSLNKKTVLYSYQKYYQNINNINDIEDLIIEGCNKGIPESQKLNVLQKIQLKTGLYALIFKNHKILLQKTTKCVCFVFSELLSLLYCALTNDASFGPQ